MDVMPLVDVPDPEANAVGRSDEDLFVELYPGLRRFAAVVGPSELDPDDLLQEALVRVLSARPLASIADPGAYLRSTILRVAANHRRRFGRARRALQRFQGEKSDVVPADEGLRVLELLDARDRAVLVLSVLEDRSTGDVAALLGCSEGAVRMRKHRALERLRRVLAEESGDE